MRPFMSYYGGKWAIAGRYPAPLHEMIVEPFAGSAGYSVRHHARRVVLIDANPKVVGVWQYLIRTPAEQIAALPLLEIGQRVDELEVCQEAGWLIGWWVNKGSHAPCQALSAWARDPQHASQFWGPRIRHRIASQVDRIRHWQAVQADYTEADQYVSGEATWFVDPPYQGRPGRKYLYQCRDYADLAAWCKSRPGQVVVCEHSGADWLPFESLNVRWATRGRHDTAHSGADEMVWTS